VANRLLNAGDLLKTQYKLDHFTSTCVKVVTQCLARTQTLSWNVYFVYGRLGEYATYRVVMCTRLV